MGLLVMVLEGIVLIGGIVVLLNVMYDTIRGVKPIDTNNNDEDDSEDSFEDTNNIYEGSDSITKEIFVEEKLYIDEVQKNFFKFHFYVTCMKKKINLFAHIHNLFFSNSPYEKIGAYYYKKDKVKYEFYGSEDIFRSIRNTIFKSTMNLNDFSLMMNHHEGVHYALEMLARLNKIQEDIDFQKEIVVVSNYLNEVVDYAENMESKVSEEVEKLRKESINNITEKHNIAMEQLITKAKIFNAERE